MPFTLCNIKNQFGGGKSSPAIMALSWRQVQCWACQHLLPATGTCGLCVPEAAAAFAVKASAFQSRHTARAALDLAAGTEAAQGTELRRHGQFGRTGPSVRFPQVTSDSELTALPSRCYAPTIVRPRPQHPGHEGDS